MTMGCRSLTVKRTATGLGLFTLLSIRAGRRIIEYVGPVITTEEADRLGGKYLFAVDDERAIDGRARDNTARYINHSCRPNAEAFTSGRCVWIYSKRTIQAGEQITIDYGEEYINAHMKPSGCKCTVCIADTRPLMDVSFLISNAADGSVERGADAVSEQEPREHGGGEDGGGEDRQVPRRANVGLIHADHLAP